MWSKAFSRVRADLVRASHIYPMLGSYRERLLVATLARVTATATLDVPFWRDRFAGRPPRFSSLAEFARAVPLTDKQTVFGATGHGLDQLVRHGRFQDVRAILSSSGSSGSAHSFGFASATEVASGAAAVDDALDRFFEVRTRRTLIVNALPSGVGVPSTSCVVATTGTREDLVSAHLRNLAGFFDQVIVFAEVPFARCLVDRAAEDGFTWGQHRTHLVVGGDYLAENVRSRLARILEIDLDDPREERFILSTLGLGEVGVNLFFETPPLVRLRRALARDSTLRTAICGRELPTAPLLMLFDPGRCYLEEVEGQLIITMLDPDRLQPVIRYRTGDRGGIVPFTHLREAMVRSGRLDLLPSVTLDVAWMYGRAQTLEVGSGMIAIPEVHEALAASEALALATTGAFHLSPVDGVLQIDLQLRPGVNEFAAEESTKEVLAQVLTAPVRLRGHRFTEYAFTHADIYEAKFRYV